MLSPVQPPQLPGISELECGEAFASSRNSQVACQDLEATRQALIRLAWRGSACVQTAIQKPTARECCGPHLGHSQLHLDRQVALLNQSTVWCPLAASRLELV